MVTGGASGLGEGTVRRLAAAGADVTILDKNADRGEALAKELGGSVKFVVFSVRTYSRQLTEPSLLSAPKISFGKGTTTFSTFFDICLMSMRCGAWAASTQRMSPSRATAVSFKVLEKAIIGSFDC